MMIPNFSGSDFQERQFLNDHFTRQWIGRVNQQQCLSLAINDFNWLLFITYQGKRAPAILAKKC
jgi:hypothetical protein